MIRQLSFRWHESRTSAARRRQQELSLIRLRASLPR